MNFSRYFLIFGMAVLPFPGVETAGGFPQKRALIVAIANYGPFTGWDTIHSENDLPLVAEAARQLGIPDSGIRVLKNEEATFQGILEALYQLKESSRAGDFIYFHFSGHGQQKQDFDGDEADGFDEALVPYDSPMRFSTSYHGERLLADDYLREWIEAVRPVLGTGGGLFITLDACHSGTATRGMGFRRGTPLRMAVEGYWKQQNTTASSPEAGEWDADEGKTAAWAPCVVFSASQYNQLNWEYTPPGTGQTCGSLSYALFTSLKNAAPPGNYHELFDRINNQMRQIAPYQQPQAEGDLNTQFPTTHRG